MKSNYLCIILSKYGDFSGTITAENGVALPRHYFHYIKSQVVPNCRIQTKSLESPIPGRLPFELRTSILDSTSSSLLLRRITPERDPHFNFSSKPTKYLSSSSYGFRWIYSKRRADHCALNKLFLRIKFLANEGFLHIQNQNLFNFWLCPRHFALLLIYLVKLEDLTKFNIVNALSSLI